MQHKVTPRNTSTRTIGKLTCTVDNGQLMIRDGAYYWPLTGQETHALLNLLMDYCTEIICVSVVEMREQERKNKENRGHKKPVVERIDGKLVEVVDITEDEQEQNE
jgi:hypothetical protein